MQLRTENETLRLGELVGRHLFAGAVIVLEGELGAGKTTLTKGIAKGLGIYELIKSPTYTIIREYDTGRLPLYHMDVYRTAESVDDLELDDYFYGDGVSVVEWGELLGGYLPEGYLKITLVKTDLARKAIFNPVGKNYQELAWQVEEEFKR
ncbi:MAG: tRNA (adenosine(37)-N6)-threonylcarbamoyltransferase complex ATPase subunit type 1 TsaE [Streptococcaceae bacterium]|jgi:tRNA threonylcarbamoyladenosine biosynthesis protein TsaE|nr:tRNA (adenosine(37)-N6)-threonylcarbamoyltransferase complex ATPase subunit type 1 TsaE [Streptococcaceae bacterium]